MVRQRANSWNKTCLKKGTWSSEEDQKLIAYIMRYGIWNWNEMPKFAGLSRSGKSCRLRWMNYLRPNIKRGNFSKEEEETIIHLQKILGNRWSAIAARLQQRTDNDIKNYWNTRLRKRAVVEILENSSASPTSSPSDVEAKHEINSSDVADSTMFPNTFLDSMTLIEDFPEQGCSNHVVDIADETNYTVDENFVSFENYWEIHGSNFMEQLSLTVNEEQNCQAMISNSQLWLHEPKYVCDSYYDPVDDFWVNPFI